MKKIKISGSIRTMQIELFHEESKQEHDVENFSGTFHVVRERTSVDTNHVFLWW